MANEPRIKNVNCVVANNGETLLHMAAYNGENLFCQFLIDNGADVNCRNSEGKTPLYYATENAHRDVVETLFAAGANPYCKDKDGKSPITLLMEFFANIEQSDQHRSIQ